MAPVGMPGGADAARRPPVGCEGDGARMQVVSAYEERLRRVEESVTELFDGDRRHLV